MKKEIMGGELFVVKSTGEYLRTAISYGMNSQMEYERNIFFSTYKDKEFLDITNYGIYEEEAFNEVFKNNLTYIRNLTDEDDQEKVVRFKEAIALAKEGNEESNSFLENYYRKVFNIRIENEGYDSDKHPLSREEILEAGIKGLKKAVEVYDEKLGKFDTLIRQYGDREMISAIKRSTRKKK